MVNSPHLLLSEFVSSSNCLTHILDWVNCVRWNPTGEALASACYDTTSKLLDFKTGKVLYTGTTSDGSKLLQVVIIFMVLIGY